MRLPFQRVTMLPDDHYEQTPLSPSSNPSTDSESVETGRRLALFLSGLSGGGAQRRMLTLARGFAARGHQVDLVVVRSGGPFRALVDPSVRLVALEPRLAALPFVATRRGLFVIAAVPALAGYLRRVRPAALLATSNPANLAALWARRLAAVPVPVVVSVNVHLSRATGPGRRFWGPLLRMLIRNSYPHADRVIAISSGVATDLARTAGVPCERITTIYNPVDVDDIEERARAPLDHPWLAPGAPPVVLGVGKLKRQKDFATLLGAFARVRRVREARLVILGEGEERRRLVRRARRLGIADDVLLAGHVGNPFCWMARAATFVLSSQWEGLSNVLLEALACGCPVVSTDCPSGPAEILAGGDYGALVPVGDEGALARAILLALDRPRDATRLRARAAAFSVDVAAERYLEVLLHSCDRSHTAGAGVHSERPNQSSRQR